MRSRGKPGNARDVRWMQRALQLARRGEGGTRPNPPVGAVLVRDDVVLGEGYHRKAGSAHAEIVALRQASRAHRSFAGATLYVTLEPCSTHGRTPPCTEAILSHGVTRVVVAVLDPNPRHAGKGLKLLRKQGVEVVTGVCRDEGDELLAPFRHWILTGQPMVTLKLATSLDGCIADYQGRSQWITGAAARREVHALRRRVDVIMVGRGTVEHDNPSLRIRPAVKRNPLRVVLDSQGRLDLASQVLSDGHADTTIVVTTGWCDESRRSAIEQTGARVWVCGRGKQIALSVLMRRLGQEGCLHVLCEGGGVLAQRLLKAGLVDHLRLYMAGRILGQGRAAFGGKWLLPKAPALHIARIRQVGGDVCIEASPLSTAEGSKSCLRD